MDPRLRAVKRSPADNSPLFYPPGSHPTTARMQAHLKRLCELEQKARKLGAELPAVAEQTTYIKDKIAEFEEKQSEMKYRYFKMLEEKEK